MTRSRSRRLLSRILWLDPEAGNEVDSVPGSSVQPVDSVPDIPTYQDRSVAVTPSARSSFTKRS